MHFQWKSFDRIPVEKRKTVNAEWNDFSASLVVSHRLWDSTEHRLEFWRSSGRILLQFFFRWTGSSFYVRLNQEVQTLNFRALCLIIYGICIESWIGLDMGKQKTACTNPSSPLSEAFIDRLVVLLRNFWVKLFHSKLAVKLSYRNSQRN